MSKKKSIIYKPDIYNFETRTSTFPDQEKLSKLKILKNAKN